jgi:hypothetical protein
MSLDTHDAGFIMFSKRVPKDTIAKFMHELQAANPQFDWLDLHMRDAGGRTAMSYRVDLKVDNDTIHERFHQQILGRLMTLLGKDEKDRPNGVDQWSMANVLESAT